MRKAKKIVVWAACLISTPFVLIFVVGLLLYLPPVQQWAVDRIAAYASEETGMDVRLERVRLSFPLDLDLQGLSVRNPDTLLDVQHVVVDLDFSHVLEWKLGVDALDFVDGTVDTQDLIATLRVKGHVGNFHMASDAISLKDECCNITGAQLNGCDLDIQMADTTVVDTTESEPIVWKILFDKVEASDTRVAFHTAGDTISVMGGVRNMYIGQGSADLYTNEYRIGILSVDADSVRYDQNYEPHTQGFDYNHLALYDVQLGAEDLNYDGTLTVNVTKGAAREKSGLQLVELLGHVTVDEQRLKIPDLRMATANSTLRADVNLDWDALVPDLQAGMNVDFDASIGKGDVCILAPDYAHYLPETPVVVEAKARGNIDMLYINRARLMLEPMIDASVHGSVSDALDFDAMRADLVWDVHTYDLSIVNRLASLGNDIRLPQMHITGMTRKLQQQYVADLQMSQAAGRADLKAQYNTQTEAYKANVSLRNMQLHNFLPKDSIYEITAFAHANGRGTDLLNPRSNMEATLSVPHLRYTDLNIDSTKVVARLAHGVAKVDFDSNNDVLGVDACAEATISEREMQDARFSLDLTRIDLHALRITDKPLVASMLTHLEGSSNLTDTHQLRGALEAVEIVTADTVFRPLDLDVALLMRPDTLSVTAYDGDMELEFATNESLDVLLDKSSRLYDELMRQLEAKNIDQDTLRTMLPTAHLHLKSGSRNPIGNILASLGYSMRRMNIHLDSSADRGLNGDGFIASLNTGAILLDSIGWTIYHDSRGLKLGATVENGPRNKQVVFRSDADVELTSTGASAAVTFLDGKGKKGIDMGAEVKLVDDGFRVHLRPLNPIIAYRGFTLNPDNYIYLRTSDAHLDAYVDLIADDGTGFKLYTTPNEEAQQDVTLSVHNFNLGELSSVIPYMPAVGGLLAGDFHMVQQDSIVTVMVDAAVKNMTYEGVGMGTLGLNAAYFPNPDGTHYVDGIVSQNGNEVMMLSGTYFPNDGDNATIDAMATLQHLPLSLANGFVPDGMITLQGYADGELSVTGRVSSPVLDGQFMTDSMYLKSDMYSLNLRFPNDTIRVNGSVLDFNRIETYSTGRNPLVLDGTVDMRSLDNIGLNLALGAKNFELINAPKRPKAVAYGKVYVDIDGTLKGTLNDMILRGKLGVLGNTDVTYVLTDSPLTVEDQLADLVTFVDFTDTTTVVTERTRAQNIDMQVQIGIDTGTQVHALLSEDGTNYINLGGGGDLTMTYNSDNGLHLYGRYTIMSGLMNYSLMVVALKNFAIESGSYVEFSGDMMNPRLAISASERLKSTVYENNVPHSVAFDVGLDVSQTLENMGLEFTLDAPEDLAVSNQIATMTPEERAKVAVTLLATGMYIADGSGGQFNGTNALNAFLQGQINGIAGKALSTIDLNFGIENTNSATGASQMDYNFSFAKRFWGNRISVIIGGKVSSGSEAQNTGQSIIDNVSLEYRLDKSATRYVRLYYDRNAESLMEGVVTEMGAGVVLRRKSTRLGELFIFKKR